MRNIFIGAAAVVVLAGSAALFAATGRKPRPPAVIA